MKRKLLVLAQSLLLLSLTIEEGVSQQPADTGSTPPAPEAAGEGDENYEILRRLLGVPDQAPPPDAQPAEPADDQAIGDEAAPADGAEAKPEPEPKPSWTLFQFSLVPPLQIFNSDRNVYGLRVNAPYGRQASVAGLDVGGFNRVDGRVRGLQLGLINSATQGAAGA